MDKTEDKRHFHRVLYSTDATLEGSGISMPCRVVDISLKGCLLHFDAPWSAPSEDSLFTLTLTLSDNVHIRMVLSVSHVIDREVGFKCEHIDIDSISELRRLVELNLGDSMLLERDLLALSGLDNA